MMKNEVIAIHINALDKLRYDCFVLGFNYKLWGELEVLDAVGSSYANELIEFLTLLSYNPLQVRNASRFVLYNTQGSNLKIDDTNIKILKGRLARSAEFRKDARYGSAPHASVLSEYRYVRELFDQLSNAYKFRDLFLIEQDNKKTKAHLKHSGQKSGTEYSLGTSSIEGNGKMASDRNLYYLQLRKGNTAYAELFNLVKQYRSDLMAYAAQHHWSFRIASIFGEHILMNANAQRQTGLFALLGSLLVSSPDADSSALTSQSISPVSAHTVQSTEEAENSSGDELCICHWADGWKRNTF